MSARRGEAVIEIVRDDFFFFNGVFFFLRQIKPFVIDNHKATPQGPIGKSSI
jgi:hypothetical protein